MSETYKSIDKWNPYVTQGGEGIGTPQKEIFVDPFTFMLYTAPAGYQPSIQGITGKGYLTAKETIKALYDSTHPSHERLVRGLTFGKMIKGQPKRVLDSYSNTPYTSREIIEDEKERFMQATLDFYADQTVYVKEGLMRTEDYVAEINYRDNDLALIAEHSAAMSFFPIPQFLWALSHPEDPDHAEILASIPTCQQKLQANLKRK